MQSKKKTISLYLGLSATVTLLPTLAVISFGMLQPIKVFLVIFFYTALIFLIGHEIAYRKILEAQNEVTELIEKEKMINGTLISINNEEKLKNVIAIEIERIRQFHKKSSVIFFDVDQMGIINDTYGYHVGDQILIELIRLTQVNMGIDDHIARIKGDTFAIILPDKSKEVAYALAEKLQCILNQTHFQHVDTITCRFAIIDLSKYSDEEEVVKLASEKLNQCKTYGKGSIL